MHAGDHGGRSSVRPEQPFGILGVALSIVEQIPIQCVGGAFGMTTSAALPASETGANVVEQHFAATSFVPLRLRSQRQTADNRLTVAREAHGRNAVREVLRHVDL